MAVTAFITGASSGTGTTLAQYHESKDGDVILTARRAVQLNALKVEIETAHGVSAHVFAWIF